MYFTTQGFANDEVKISLHARKFSSQETRANGTAVLKLCIPARPSRPLQQTYEEVQLPLLLASRIPFFLQRDGTMPTINVPALLQLRCTRNT